MKYILGISAFYHDSSACLFKNGQLVYACEEEKFTGIKHDSSFPNNALNYAIKHYKINEVKILLYNNQDKITNDIALLLTATLTVRR